MLYLATKEDIDEILIIIENAKKRMKDDGLIQWQNGIPNRDTITFDITNNQLYKYIINNQIAAICVINNNFYPEYPPHISINLAQTIHTFAVNEQFINQNIGTEMLFLAIKQIKENGYDYALIDTFSLNTKMRGLIEKCGFKNIGEFVLLNNYPNWVLYQKHIENGS